MGYFKTVYSYRSDELPKRAKLVYMYLKDRSNKNGECWPAIKTIAKETSMSVSTVKRGLNDLIKVGLIKKVARFRENGANTSNRYFIRN